MEPVGATRFVYGPGGKGTHAYGTILVMITSFVGIRFDGLGRRRRRGVLQAVGVAAVVIVVKSGACAVQRAGCRSDGGAESSSIVIVRCARCFAWRRLGKGIGSAAGWVEGAGRGEEGKPTGRGGGGRSMVCRGDADERGGGSDVVSC